MERKTNTTCELRRRIRHGPKSKVQDYRAEDTFSCESKLSISQDIADWTSFLAIGFNIVHFYEGLGSEFSAGTLSQRLDYYVLCHAPHGKDHSEGWTNFFSKCLKKKKKGLEQSGQECDLWLVNGSKWIWYSSWTRSWHAPACFHYSQSVTGSDMPIGLVPHANPSW